MLINHLKLANWRNFKEADVHLSRRVFIIGPNASGKSNFLDVFRFLKELAENGLTDAVEMRGGISSLRCFSAKRYPDITLELEIDSIWKYVLSFGGNKGAIPEVKKEQAFRMNNHKDKWISLLERPDNEDKKDPVRLTQTALEQISANKDFREIANFFKTISYQHLLPQVVRDPKDFSPKPTQNDPFGRDFIFRVWNTKEKTRNARLSKINSALKIAVPQLDELNVTLDEKTGIAHLIARYRHWRPQGAKQDESSFSDGTLRLMALLWTIFESTGPLLLEEPELSLHNEVVQKLPAIFSRIERSRRKKSRQIFVSTHSQALLQDKGIGPEEILILEPSDNGTKITHPDENDKELMRQGLTAADVLLPKTAPANIEQLSLLEI